MNPAEPHTTLPKASLTLTPNMCHGWSVLTSAPFDCFFTQAAISPTFSVISSAAPIPQPDLRRHRLPSVSLLSTFSYYFP